MKAQTQANEVQGTAEPKAKQPSVSFTIRQFGENAKKLKALKLITEEQYEELKKIHNGLMESWMNQLSL